MLSDDLLVAGVSRRPNRAFSSVLEPVFQVLRDGEILGVKDQSRSALCDGLCKLSPSLRVGLPVHHPAFGTLQGLDRISPLPPALVLPVGDSSFAGAASLPHAQSSLRFFACSANASTLSGSYSLVFEEL